MPQKTLLPTEYVQPYRYASPNIPLAAIRRYVQTIVKTFHPEKVILFGSYACGTPHNESDVDLMVIIPCRNDIDMSIRIWHACDAPFAVDLNVRDPKRFARSLADGNWFIRELEEKGRVLYAKGNSKVGAQSRSRHGPSTQANKRQRSRT